MSLRLSWTMTWNLQKNVDHWPLYPPSHLFNAVTPREPVFINHGECSPVRHMCRSSWRPCAVECAHLVWSSTTLWLGSSAPVRPVHLGAENTRSGSKRINKGEVRLPGAQQSEDTCDLSGRNLTFRSTISRLLLLQGTGRPGVYINKLYKTKI